jgi:hypothetical protein
MNKQLTNAIAHHIFANLLVVPSDFINMDKSKSLLSKEYLLDKKLVFEEEGTKFKNNVWGCQIATTEQGFKLILADCTGSDSKNEYCLIVSSDNFPTYGVYLASEDLEDNNSLISVSVDEGKNWMACKTYLQATFLAGMEQIKELPLNWNKCLDYDKEFKMVTSFLNHREQLSEVGYEG